MQFKTKFFNKNLICDIGKYKKREYLKKKKGDE